MLEVLNLKTSKKDEFYEITSMVKEVISQSNVDEGICIIYTPHTTSGITINENADFDVKRDMIISLNEIVKENPNFNHYEGNSVSHVKASIIGSSVTIIIEKGEALLGTWQGIYFCEFDGSRNRKCFVKII